MVKHASTCLFKLAETDVGLCGMKLIVIIKLIVIAASDQSGNDSITLFLS